MATETCISCGIKFDVPDEFQRRRKEDHKTIYCPNGHSQHYPQESNEERLNRLLTWKENENSSLRGRNKALLRSNIALRAVVTRIKNQAREPAPIKDIERVAIINALEFTKGNRDQAARLLKIGQRTLYRKLKTYGLKIDKCKTRTR